MEPPTACTISKTYVPDNTVVSDVAVLHGVTMFQVLNAPDVVEAIVARTEGTDGVSRKEAKRVRVHDLVCDHVHFFVALINSLDLPDGRRLHRRCHGF